MKKILFYTLLLSSILAMSSQRAVAQCNYEIWRFPSPQPNLSSADASQSNFAYCAGSELCLTPPCIDPLGGCSFDHFEFEPANGGFVNGPCGGAGNGSPYTSISLTGNTIDGEVGIKALYDCVDFTGAHFAAVRMLRVRYVDMANAGTFTIAANSNLCPSPLTSITINRDPRTFLVRYQVRVINNTNGAVVFDTGTISGNMTTYTINSNQVNTALLAGSSYRVELTAFPENASSCGTATFNRQSKTFVINNTPTTAKFTINNNGKIGDFQEVYLCDANTSITVNNQSTSPVCAPLTGVKFRYIQFLYGSTTAPPMYASYPGIETAWLAPATTYDIRNVIPNMNASNGYFSLEMQVKTSLLTSAWTTIQYVHIQQPPNSAVVADFGFMGSSAADDFATYTCTNAADGELSPIGGTGCANNDGWLGNGGLLTNPIWVGATSMAMGGAAISNVFGGMQSYRVEIWQATQPTTLIGSYAGTGTFFPVNGININNEILCGYAPAAPTTYFFSDKLRSAGGATFFNGKIFQAKLFVKDVCGREFQSDDKKGFFKVIPNNANWRSTGKTYEELDAMTSREIAQNELSVTPNPAQQQINLRFYAESEGEGTLDLIDVNGKTVSTKVLC